MIRSNGFNVVFIVVLALALFLFVGPVFAQDAKASIFSLEGNPKIMKSGNTQWQECEIDMPIDTGDHIKTLKEEWVEISFLNDRTNMVKVEGDSDIVIKKNEAPYSLDLISGSVMALIRKLPKNSTFEVTTPVGLCGARGTGWRSSTDNTRSRFAAFEHRIYVRGIDTSGKPMKGELIVKKGWANILNKFEKPEKLDRLLSGDIKRWNIWKKSLTDRIRNSDRSLDKADRTEDRIGKLQSMKSDIREASDINRVESQLNKGTVSRTRNDDIGNGKDVER